MNTRGGVVGGSSGAWRGRRGAGRAGAAVLWGLLAGAVAPAQEGRVQMPSEIEGRLRAIYERKEFAARPFVAAWSPDGAEYLRLEASTREGAQDVVAYDPAGGRRTVRVTAEKIAASDASGRRVIRDFSCAPRGRRLLLRVQGAGGDAESRCFDPESGELRGIDAGLSPVGGAAFSPDGERLLCARRGNLFVADLARGRTTRLTADGVPGTVEYAHAGWSPDGRHVAFVRVDSSAIPMRPVLVPGDPTYRGFRNERYARIGGPIATLRIGVVGAEGGDVRWLDLPDPPATYYLRQATWAANSEELLVDKLSRYKDVRECLLVNRRSGAVALVYRESDPAWVDAEPPRNGGVEWIRDGRACLLLSERDGWRRAYLVSRDGLEMAPVTPAGVDVIARGRVDEQAGWFYYLASPSDATQRHLYRARLDGSGPAERLTPADRGGSHAYQYSPDGRWAFHTSSTFDRPPTTELVSLPEHRSVRMLEGNEELAARAAPLVPRPTEFLKLDIGGGVVMDAWMIQPRDFDPARKYPLLVFVYGEPAGQTVLDEWSGGQGNTLFHRAIAELGVVVVSIDNRGTPAPKGAAWRRAIFGSLGPLSTEEQAAGVKALAARHPFVDLERVAIWGWSGGGSNTLNALFRKPELYRVGIAVVPKPQPHLYNAGYQEVYMRTPADNPEGYRASAPIRFAEGLRGKLLIVVGSGETNTHVEVTEGLVDRLVELGKTFDYMVYPNRDHGLREGKGTELHLRKLMVRYLIDHLSPGAR